MATPDAEDFWAIRVEGWLFEQKRSTGDYAVIGFTDAPKLSVATTLADSHVA